MITSLLISIQMLINNDQAYLTQFNKDDPKWHVVNDRVMGGLSTSEITQENGIAIFKGKVSLENNGGFASVRMPVEREIKGDFKNVILRIKGDGKSYQFRIRKSREFDGLAYDYKFASKDNEWLEIKIPLNQMQGTYRGNEYPDKVGVGSHEIKQIGFLISEKQEGDFCMKIDFIALAR